MTKLFPLLLLTLSVIFLATCERDQSFFEQTSTNYLKDAVATIITGQTYVYDASNQSGLNITRSTPTTLTLNNNSITGATTSGFIVQAGDDLQTTTNNNLDGAIITGIKIMYTGSGSNSNHVLQVGYNINDIIRYNYIDGGNGAAYGIIAKASRPGYPNMAYTSGGISYNIIQDIGSGIHIKDMDGIRVVNNSFYLSSAFKYGYCITLQTEYNSAPQNVEIKNNIFYITSATAAPLYFRNASLSTLECDYNVYYCVNGTNHEPKFQSIDTYTWYTWAQWRAMGFDAHSIVLTVDPFVDLVNFVPKSRSVIDHGTDMGSEFNTGLSTSATWVVGSSPATTSQNGTWQVGARVFAAAGSAPLAAFTANTTSIIEGQSVTFTDQSINTPTSWSWNFGDSGTSALKNPSHIYSTAGTYTVILTATNSYGSDVEIKTSYITVTPDGIVPVAAFTGIPTTITVGSPVTFTDQSTNLPSSWYWTFGDGGSSILRNPTYVYNTLGTYTVSLIATSAYGSNTVTKINYIAVISAGPSAFLTSDTYTKAWYDFALDVTKDGSNLVRAWGDQSSSNLDLSYYATVPTSTPTWSPDGITFDGSDDELLSSALTLNNPSTVYIVIKQLRWTSNARIFSSSAFRYPTDMLWQYDSFGFNAPELGIRGTINPNMNNADCVIGEWHIITAVFNGSNSSLRIDEETATTGDIGICGFNGIMVGGWYDGHNNHSNIIIIEFIFRSHVDTASEKTEVYNYLKTKYSL